MLEILADLVRPNTRDNAPLFALRILKAMTSAPFDVPLSHPHQQNFSQCAVCSFRVTPQSFEAIDGSETWPVLVGSFRFHHDTTFANWSHQLPPYLASPRHIEEYRSCVIVGLQDTQWGSFRPGDWVHWHELMVRGAPREVWQSFREGLPYRWALQPVAQNNRQGPMFDQPREKLSLTDRLRLDVAITEFESDCALGKQEGRLSFRPPTTVHLSILTKKEWVRAPDDLHTTDYKVIERDKHRQLAGAKAAGLSEAFEKAPTTYPTVFDAIAMARHKRVGRRDDIKKAFKAHVVPWWQRAVICTRHPVLSIYVQHTSLVFGVVPGPQRQMLFSSWVCHARSLGYGATVYDLPSGMARVLADEVPVQPPCDPVLRPIIVMMDDFFQHGIKNTVDDDAACRHHLLLLLRHVYRLCPFPPVDPEKSWAGIAFTVFGTFLDADRSLAGLTNEKSAKYAFRFGQFLAFYEANGYVTRLEMARITGYANCIAPFSRLRFYLVELFEVLYPRTPYGDVDDWKYAGSPTELMLPSSQRDRRHKPVACNRCPVPQHTKFIGGEHLSPTTCEATIFEAMIANVQLFARCCHTNSDTRAKIYLDKALPGVWYSHGIRDVKETYRHLVPDGKFTDSVATTAEGIPVTSADAAFERAATTHAAESMVITYDGIADTTSKNIMPLEALVGLWSPLRWEANMFDTIRGRRRVNGVWRDVPDTDDRRVLNLCDNSGVTYIWVSGITSNRLTMSFLRMLERQLSAAKLDVALHWTDTDWMPADRFTRSKFGFEPWTQAIRLTTDAWIELCDMIGWAPTHEAYAHVGNARAPSWNSPCRPFNHIDAARDRLLVNVEFRNLLDAVHILETADLRRCAFIWPPDAPSVRPRAEEIQYRLRCMGFSRTGRFETRRSVFESPPTYIAADQLSAFDPSVHFPCGPLPWHVEVWSCH